MQEMTPELNRVRLMRIIEPIIYGDVFEYPVTLREIRKYCTLPLSRQELQSEIRNNLELKKLVSQYGDYFYLNGQKTLPGIRLQRRASSAQAWQRARKVVKYIKYIPFLKGIMATGSLAVNNIREEDDLDFMVIISANRLWFVFAVLGTLQRIFSRRILCPNYYISLDHISMTRKSFYVAREAAQARAMYGVRCCRLFYEKNRWLYDVFPNLESIKEVITGESGVVERRGLARIVCESCEWMLRGRLGNLVEAGLKRILRHRLSVHYGIYNQPVPEDVLKNALNEVELRFHGLKHEEAITREVAARKKATLALLENGDSDRNDSGTMENTGFGIGI